MPRIPPRQIPPASTRVDSTSPSTGTTPPVATDASTPATPAAPASDASPAGVVDRYETVDRDAKYMRPSHYAGTSGKGYKWKKEDLDSVMHRFAVGDVDALIATAAALDRGDKVLSAAELTAAARKETAYVSTGVKFSPTMLADIMTGEGIAAETALVRAAKQLDDGDRVLERPELSAAAQTLNSIVAANDIAAVKTRIDALAGNPAVKTTSLGTIAGHEVKSLRFEAKKQPAKLEIMVTAGVHGSEPCGTGAALLLIDQLLKDPRLTDEVTFTVVPLMNPRGFAAGTRHTPEGDDLNRHFHLEHQDPDHRPPEVEMLETLLEKERPQLVLDLHSGGANREGFWLYHKNGAQMGKAVMDQLDKDFPLLMPEDSRRVMHSPGVVESDKGPAGVAHKGTLKDFAMDHGAKWAFTVEAPGSVSYLDQVMGENEIVHLMVTEALALNVNAPVA